MSLNPVLDILGRRLRLALIGGGPGSFIGRIHQTAARIDDRYEIVTGVLSSNPQRAQEAGRAMGFAPDRIFGNVEDMLDAEALRSDGVDVIAIMTPNDSHLPYSLAALDRGFDVICDKPLTNSAADAKILMDKVEEKGLVFCLTHNYTGYPMVRQARAMVEAGEIGDLRLVQVEYVQGGRADESKAQPTTGYHAWKFDSAISGPSLVMGDIGTHAHHLLRFITGKEVTEVCAEAGTIVPGRQVQDFTGALLRMEEGVRGVFWVTQAAAGIENSLKIRISGNKGTLEWFQEIPQRLQFSPLGRPAEVRTPNGPGTLPAARRASRIVAGHPEGFPEGFANIYSDASEAIAARRGGVSPDPLALWHPTVRDGWMGLRFIEACLESTAKNGSWMKV